MMDIYMDITGLGKVATMLHVARAQLAKKLEEELKKKTGGMIS
jgi:hypothetical protein